MGNLANYIGRQFGNPRGAAGWICCQVMNGINRPMYRAALALLEIAPEDRILDIGYGNGYLLRQIDRAFSPELYGIDPSEDMKTLAARRCKRAARQGRLRLTVGDCCALPYEDGMFAAVTSVNTVYFWPEPEKGMEEICRCLRSGGVFYNVLYTREWLNRLPYTQVGFRTFRPQELAELGLRAGFALAEIREIVPGKNFVVVYRKE
ncbi:MAG: methyltransferase domain-containing protein [Oscillibacter sp.]|jgi:arsenite methyltransferase|nr:methyltransferase domain-containing protein [Oscillibacter sp.]